MKLKKKIVILLSLFTILFVFLGTAVLAYQTRGTPFNEIWDAIFGLKKDVNDVQTQIDEIEFVLESPAVQGPQGEQGPQGPPGPKGDKGDPGEPGLGFEQTCYLSFSPLSFTITWPWQGYEYDWRIYENELANFESIYEGAATFTAPIVLPHGVIVTNLTVHYQDTVEEDLECRLIRNQIDSGTLSLAKVQSITGENSGNDEPTIYYSQIDNINYCYYLKVYIPKNSSPWDLVFKNAIITYEYTK